MSPNILDYLHNRVIKIIFWVFFFLKKKGKICLTGFFYSFLKSLAEVTSWDSVTEKYGLFMCQAALFQRCK